MGMQTAFAGHPGAVGPAALALQGRSRLSQPARSAGVRYAGVTVGRRALEGSGDQARLSLHIVRTVGDSNVSALIGRAYRNFVTGKVQVKQVGGIPDFSFTDLWTRPTLFGSKSEFAADKYIFRPVVLAYRTWLYHEVFRSGKSEMTTDEAAVVKRVLALPCIDVDAPLRAGLWSPVLSYAPAAFVASLTGDLAAGLLAAVALATLYVASALTNRPGLYRYDRLLTVALRLAYLVALLARSLVEEPLGALARLLLGLCALIVMADLLLGDLAQLLCLRFTCSYEVIRELPHRVFVCRREGATELEKQFGDRGSVDESVTGTGKWESTFSLIADVQGVLVELRPVNEEEWELALQEYAKDFDRPRSFVGLDVFGGELATLDNRILLR